MTPSTDNEPLGAARREIAALRDALLNPSPENLQSRIPALERAARSLEAAISAGASWPETARKELEALASGLRSCASLIDHGRALHQAWATILASASAGYSPRGEAAALPQRSTISLRG